MQRNFLRENRLLVRQTTLRRMERERQRQLAGLSAGYELPTTASMGRCAVTPPLMETQRRLLGGGRVYLSSAMPSSSEKQIQTEDISDEQFLNAALLKCCPEQTQGQSQAQVQGQGVQWLRGCSEGDEPLLTSNSSSGYEDSGGLRRTASNFELGKMAAQRSGYQAIRHLKLGAVTDTLPRRLDELSAEPGMSGEPAEAGKPEESQANADCLSVKSTESEASVHQAVQLAIPDITDVEQNPQLDQSLSGRSNASSLSRTRSKANADALKAQREAEQRERQRLEREREQERARAQEQVLLPEPQRVALLQAKQERYRDLIWQYNRLPLSMGTLRVRNLKIELEHELDRIDRELSKLASPQVYIRRDQLQQICCSSC